MGAKPIAQAVAARLCFNPRTRDGCEIGSQWIADGGMFQSTHP